MTEFGEQRVWERMRNQQRRLRGSEARRGCGSESRGGELCKEERVFKGSEDGERIGP